MALVFAVTLCISIVGLVSLLAIKRWELENKTMVLAPVRPWFGNVSHASLMWLERALPSLATGVARRAAHEVRIAVRQNAAKALLWAEHSLERVLAALRGVTEPPKSTKEASQFLREIAEHKRTLLERKNAEENEQ